MSIRLISAKYEVNPVNIRKILNLLSSIYRQVPKVRFEIIENETRYQFKFVILKSRLSVLEKYWIKKKLKRFIQDDSR